MNEAERYLVLGLRLGKHVDGLVDAYYGPPELQEQVDAEDNTDVAQLAADADELLAELDDGWLADQVHGCATYAHVLAGDAISYSDEVEGCYGVRPTRVDDSAYAEVHAQLDELLPGDGSLFERRQSWREQHRCPGDKAVAVLGELLPVLRACTSRLLELPPGEELTLEPVQDEPWWAFNYYQGNLRSRVVLNTDIPTSGRDLLRLVGHEVYPGHHTEHAVKEQLLLRDQGRIEEGIQLVPTPQALLSEGIAEAGLDIVLDEAAKEEAYAIIRRHDIQLDDPELVERIATTFEGLGTVGVNAALMVHEEGASVDEAAAYIEKWNLVTARAVAAERALHHRPDLARVRDHLHGGPRAVPRLHRRRSCTVSDAAHRARSDRRPGRVEVVRVRQRLDQIYAIAQHRAGYSAEEDAAHELAAGWLTEAGLEVSRDEAGNLFGRRGDARVWAGSHLDSVPTGGRFDGALGVVAAIEAAERLPAAPLAVVAFRAEETGPMGSKRLQQFPDAYLELHIEQGPVLALAGEPLGVVTAIAGAARGAKVFSGRADHAGHDADGRARRRARRRSALHPARARVRHGRGRCDRRRDRGRAERDQRRPGARHRQRRCPVARLEAAGRPRRGDRLRADPPTRAGGAERRLRRRAAGRAAPRLGGRARRDGARACGRPELDAVRPVAERGRQPPSGRALERRGHRARR